MSVQEERFADIAAAIREKDGTVDPIRALGFAARIRAIGAGGGGGSAFAVPLVVTVDAGAVITATNGGHSVTATAFSGCYNSKKCRLPKFLGGLIQTIAAPIPNGWKFTQLRFM